MNKCLTLYASDDQIVLASKKEYLQERQYFRDTGKCFSDDPKTQRKLKYWIDLGRTDYLKAKSECEQKSVKFDWINDHCKFTSNRN